MPTDNTWFHEACLEGGSSFGLKLKAKLHSEKSPFQQIDIYDTKTYGKLMTIDGFVMLTTRDNFLYHEMMSHPALFTHPNPQRVIIIGGGDCGTLKEVLKHKSVQHVTQVDIDERVTRLSEEYFPELCISNHDPRAKLLFDDGVAFMEKAENNSVDIIIIDSTDPVGPGEGLFTEQFYKNCKRVLGDNGLIIQQSESPLYHASSIILPMRQKMQRTGFAELKTFTFPQPCYPSGWWSCTLAGNNLNTIRANDIKNKSFATQYYHLPIHQNGLTEIPLLQQLGD